MGANALFAGGDVGDAGLLLPQAVSNVTATSTPYLRKPTSRLDRLIGCGTRIILLARYRAPFVS